jgi:hypothetical protein
MHHLRPIVFALLWLAIAAAVALFLVQAWGGVGISSGSGGQ